VVSTFRVLIPSSMLVWGQCWLSFLICAPPFSIQESVVYKIWCFWFLDSYNVLSLGTFLCILPLFMRLSWLKPYYRKSLSSFQLEKLVLHLNSFKSIVDFLHDYQWRDQVLEQWSSGVKLPQDSNFICLDSLYWNAI